MAPEGLYSGVAAVVFVMAGRAPGLKRRFYFKNLAFSVGMVCIALIAVQSTAFAGLRVWLFGEGWRVILETLNALEACLAISCILAFTAGLSLRYTPAVATTLLHRLQTGWLSTQEHFESLEWRRQRRCGRSVDLRIRRRRRGVPHKGFVRVGHPSSLPGLRAHPDGPNVVLVESGRRDHLGAYGHGWIRTPNLDALAKESLRASADPTPSLDRSASTGRTLAQGRKLGPAVHNPEGASETELKKRTLANSTTSARRGLRTPPG